jgi:hypothetical protein
MSHARGGRTERLKAEARFPVRLTLDVPKGGWGSRLNEMREWLDQRLGKAGYAWLPAGVTGGRDRVHLYLPEVGVAVEFSNAIF